MTRRYYSIRTGRHPNGFKLSLDYLLKLFLSVYSDLDRRGYFQEAFGYDCVDAGYVPGTLGTDIKSYFIRKLRKDNLWPIEHNCDHYTEDDLFDVIELLYDHVSKPVKGWNHTYGDCGWHYDTFNKQPGKEEFRAEINDILKDYGNHELSELGEIFNPVYPGTQELFNNLSLASDPHNVSQRVDEAIRLYRHHGSSIEDKHRAVRDLADVLEYLRPQIKQALSKQDEIDLFNIANNFGIRHHTDRQRTDYDKNIWLDWMFYYYLATINTVDHLINRKDINSEQ